MDIIVKKYGFKEGLTTMGGKITNWPYEESQPSQDEIEVMIAKDSKKEEIKSRRQSRFSDSLLVKNIDDKAYYVKTDPEINIFQSAILMGDNDTRKWGCYCEGEKILIELTKSELVSLAHHYEERKNSAYNQCDLARGEIDKLTTLEEVKAFDITKIYE